MKAKDVCFKINGILIFKLSYAGFGLNGSPFQLEPDPGRNITDGVFIKNNIYFSA